MKHMKRMTHKTKLAIIVLVIIFGCVALAVGCAPKNNDSGAGTSSAATGEAATQAGTGAGENTPVSWSMQSDCVSCHTSEVKGASDSKHLQAVAHADLACVTCHTKESELGNSHANITLASKPASKPTIISVEEQTCISCHGTLQDVALLTATSTALKDDQGLVVNPHQRPAGTTHDQKPATCTNCHNNHSETLARDAKKYCASCHHRGIWQCGTCHETRS